MAGSVTVTTSDIGNGITKYSVAWTASAGGAVSGNAFGIKTGRLLWAKFAPSDESATQPTNAYDVTLTDDDGVDLLRGLGANLSDSDETIQPAVSVDFISHIEGDNLDLVIANAGNAAEGRVDLFVGP